MAYFQNTSTANKTVVPYSAVRIEDYPTTISFVQLYKSIDNTGIPKYYEYELSAEVVQGFGTPYLKAEDEPECSEEPNKFINEFLKKVIIK